MSDNTEIQITKEYYQTDNNSDNVDTPISLLHEEFSQIIQNFYKMNVKEIGPTTQDINEPIFEEDLSRKKFVLDLF